MKKSILTPFFFSPGVVEWLENMGRYTIMPESYVTNQTEKGNISISEDVVTVMVTAAIAEIDGVAGLSNPTSTDIAEFFGLKNAAKGVKITAENGEMTVDVVILVRYGYGVTVVAKRCRSRWRPAWNP